MTMGKKSPKYQPINKIQTFKIVIFSTGRPHGDRPYNFTEILSAISYRLSAFSAPPTPPLSYTTQTPA